MTSGASNAPVGLTLHGVTLEVSSELDAFTAYVEETMRPFLGALTPPVRVESRLEWVEGAPARDLETAFGVNAWDRRPDRDLYVAGSSVYWLRIDDFEDFQLAARWEQDRLSIRGRYYFRTGKGRGESLRKFLYRGRMDALRGRRFSTLLYYLVYHPILWILSREMGLHLLHGGAVASPDGAAVFGGMPGCGKSTLAVAMTGDPRWTLLSDNLVLYDAHRVLACPELLLLDARSLERIGSAASRLKATGERRVYERSAYRPDRTMLEPTVPSAIFNVERARSTSMEEISPRACATRLGVDTWMAKEVRRAVLMGHVLDLVSGRTAPEPGAALETLTAGARCYALRIGEDAALSGVIDKHVLRAVCPDRSLRRHTA